MWSDLQLQEGMNDSFDWVFNKELDLEIGNKIMFRGSTDGFDRITWK